MRIIDKETIQYGIENVCKKCQHFPICRWRDITYESVSDGKGGCKYFMSTKPMGEWIKDKPTLFQKLLSEETYSCSVCGSLSKYVKTNYCHNCGTHMKVEN